MSEYTWLALDVTGKQKVASLLHGKDQSMSPKT